jgi:UDP-N-acetylglucosamine 2-epimerase (non-hydrolysing)
VMARRQRVLVVVGSRPEAIKMAPVVLALRDRADAFDVLVCATGQQRDLIPQALAEFDLRADLDLGVMRAGQSLAALTARLLVAFDDVLVRHRPDWVLVQGDTTSAMAGAMAAFYRAVPVAHIEAGMRTGNRSVPFPEEVNRRIITRYASLHFAPTRACSQHLMADGVAASDIVLVGNTVVDAILWIRDRCRTAAPALPDSLRGLDSHCRIVLVTCHRREMFGKGLREICGALVDISQRVSNALIVYPVHPNPRVAGPVSEMLGSLPGIVLVPPLPYRDFVALMDRAELILTDSGGLQEEAPSLGKPVLVMRQATERTEGVDAGGARVVGTSRRAIVDAVVEVLTDRRIYAAMASVANPYGDGHAARRIVEQLERAGAGQAQGQPVAEDLLRTISQAAGL